MYLTARTLGDGGLVNTGHCRVLDQSATFKVQIHPPGARSYLREGSDERPSISFLLRSIAWVQGTYKTLNISINKIVCTSCVNSQY